MRKVQGDLKWYWHWGLLETQKRMVMLIMRYWKKLQMSLKKDGVERIEVGLETVVTLFGSILRRWQSSIS